MKRFLAGIVVLVLTAGCAGSADPGSSRATDDIELAAANLRHLTGTHVEATSAGEAVNAFGLDLYRAVAGGDRTANLVISPASVAIALAMARAGARGQTAAEMDAVMRDLGTDEHAAWVAALDVALGARTGRFADLSGNVQDVTLRIVNAPFAQRGLRLEQPFLDALASRFGAGLRLVDYEAANEAARRLINGWVAGQTERRIEELLAPGDVGALTRLVLVNAIYLKAAWLIPFEEAATQPAPFTRHEGSAVDVPMMHGGGDLDYAQGDGWRAIDLPYASRQLSLLVIVPDDLAAFETGFDATRLRAIVTGLEEREVVLGLPRFGAESHLQLAPVLDELGMPTAFTDRADFSGITSEAQLLISAVVHQANIDVDEKGTEAAAATAVVMRDVSARPDPVTLTIDRPFLFALHDVETGAVLFLGRIGDPSAS